MTTATLHRITVGAADQAGRLDAFLAARLPDLSRSRVAQLLADGMIRVNGDVPRKSYRPAAGDIIEVSVPAAAQALAAPEAIPIRIVHEDEDLAVIDKPAGLVVHPAPGHPSGTLVNALLHHVRDLSGIIHRLDRDTSGLLLVAKNDAAHRTLSAALRDRRIRRIYLAAAWGHLGADDVVVDAPVGRASRDRKRMAVTPTGRHAVTRLTRLARWRAADLLRAELETGRTHQIRVHLAHIGHPVVGDRTYGTNALRGISGPDRGWAARLDRMVGRQFLHATELRFDHPRTGEALRFESPLPADLAAAAAWASGGDPRS